jgi:hypothetical protein
MFTIPNIRLGFATNSSSSHSIVFMKEPASAGSGDAKFEFGWDNFKLRGENTKACYLAASIYSSLSNIPEWQRRAVVISLFKGSAIEDDLVQSLSNSSDYIYVDHQSAFNVAGLQSEHFPLLVAEAAAFFRDPRIVVHGGNDNTEDSEENSISGNIRIAGEYDAIRFRKDGDNYVLFNFSNGTKMRLTPGSVPYEKSTMPELVDLKITDQCAYGCTFCYMGSTPGGHDVNPRQVRNIIEALGVKGLGIFELAIGGGEPTASDNFITAIREARRNVIVPNFTTFAVDWLLDEEKLAAAKDCGGIGVSVLTKKDIAKAERIREKVGNRVTAQHVYGSQSPAITRDIMSKAREKKIPLLLLGRKETGRGKGTPWHDMSILNSADHKGIRDWEIPDTLSVDTAFVAQEAAFVERVTKGCDKFVSKKEGAFSMYIDAVKGTAHASSYDESIARHLTAEAKPDELVRQIQAAYATF